MKFSEHTINKLSEKIKMNEAELADFLKWLKTPFSDKNTWTHIFEKYPVKSWHDMCVETEKEYIKTEREYINSQPRPKSSGLTIVNLAKPQVHAIYSHKGKPVAVDKKGNIVDEKDNPYRNDARGWKAAGHRNPEGYGNKKTLVSM